MDDTDRKILKLLQGNARLTVRKIGEIIGLTPPATAERIKRMESHGVIDGYHAAVNPDALGKTVRAYMCVDVNKNKHVAFDAFCTNSPAVVSFTKVIGTYYAILLLAVESTSDLSDVLDSIKYYGGTTTHTALIVKEMFANRPL